MLTEESVKWDKFGGRGVGCVFLVNTERSSRLVVARFCQSKHHFFYIVAKPPFFFSPVFLPVVDTRTE